MRWKHCLGVVRNGREEQESSIKIQMETYQQIIEEHPDWELAEIYADPGATGLMASKRPGFLRMIEDAKEGKIDIILAKSISRFARNTEDMLKYTRMLRSIGVGVIFEKEKIDTKGKKGNGCKNMIVPEDELLEALSDTLGIEWDGAENAKESDFDSLKTVKIYDNGTIEIDLYTEKKTA